MADQAKRRRQKRSRPLKPARVPGAEGSRDLGYVQDILGAAEIIAEYVRGKVFPDFVSHRMLRDAVVRQITIVAEAANNLSAGFRKQHAQVPWKKIADARNLMIHRYWTVDFAIVWEIATTHVPDLRRELRAMRRTTS